ncbi:Uu.00g125360.m01.CDS01 [Anthostomella pinea]|uniref:Uu.00g125360.m01.CDS01 n=1 Tax=Anthostomella pinea TaxID=933095 RepID=A0AAI8VHS8_9PEZI|nr:Uu.00g125360.m01.CDS01 [Anthostomella pinea]
MAEKSSAQREVQGDVVTPFGVGSPRKVPMKVIVGGPGRTGTASMKTALEILGFPCYHAFNLWEDSTEHMEGWNRAIEAKYHGKATFGRYDWDEILGNHLATVDAPSAFFAPELAAAYPDAKVIILNREPEAWVRSCLAAFGGMRPASHLRFIFWLLIRWDAFLLAFARHMNLKQADIWGFEWDDADAREKALRWFDEYYADCRARIPEDRRIEFRVQDGWEPLCRHLGVPVPTVRVGDGPERVQVPFPWTNDAAMFKVALGDMRRRKMKGALRLWVEKICIFGAVGFGVYKSWPLAAAWLGRQSA